MNFPFQTYGPTLFIGCGGGYDVYAAIPLIGMAAGKQIFASYSDKKDFVVREAGPDDDINWFFSQKLDWAECYVLGRNGVQLVKEGINTIIEEHNIENIVAVDGGVDALMRGDEENPGTLLEDSIVLAAINDCSLPTQNKYLVCVGMGAEAEENLNFYRALENISLLASTGNFLGSCSLVKDDEEFFEYKEICVTANKEHRISHIQPRIIKSVEGEFGWKVSGTDARCFGTEEKSAFHSPLMSIYWFFDLPSVVGLNKVIPTIRSSRIFTDAFMMYRQNLIEPSRSFGKILSEFN